MAGPITKAMIDSVLEDETVPGLVVRPTCPDCRRPVQRFESALRNDSQDFEAQCCGLMARATVKVTQLRERGTLDIAAFVTAYLEIELRDALLKGKRRAESPTAMHRQIFDGVPWAAIEGESDLGLDVILDGQTNAPQLAFAVRRMAAWVLEEGRMILVTTEIRGGMREHLQIPGVKWATDHGPRDVLTTVTWTHLPPHMVFVRDGVEIAYARVSNLATCIQDFGPWADEHNEAGPGVAYLRIGYGVRGDEVYFEQWKLDATVSSRPTPAMQKRRKEAQQKFKALQWTGAQAELFIVTGDRP